jgi:secreted trypsin-like serine protease
MKWLLLSLAFALLTSCKPTSVEVPPPDATFDSGAPSVETCVYKASRVSRTERATRVVGGTNAPPGAYPWVCSIELPTGQHYCGGSLIAPQTVLTAAHCQVLPGDLVVCGRTDLHTSDGWTRVATDVRNHAVWQYVTSGSDVAVVRLDSEIPTTPITLGAASAAVDALVLGWGATVEGGHSISLLKRGTVALADCSPYGADIDSTMLCAAAPGVDGCQGDSGGPLYQAGAQIGLTSWGAGCARPGLPGVYTDVSEMAEWIKVCSW